MAVLSLLRGWVQVSFFMLLTGAWAYSQGIVINEFMASNGETVVDEDGESSDWIELYNAGQDAVNLNGWGLSDDPAQPFLWTFPNIVMEPSEYLLVWASGKNRYYGTITQEKVFVASGTSWRYLDDGSDQGSAWRAPEFNDEAWASGPAPLGYGPQDNYVATTVSFGGNSSNKHITTYFRKDFEVSDIENVESLVLSLWLDDGAVVYLNGAELVRENMPAGEINYLTNTVTFVAEWPTWTHYQIPVASLQMGQNVLAVEVHQTSPTSSDLAFDLRLLGSVYTASLHTNFSISASGEPLLLTAPDETVIDEIPPVIVPRDISYGRVSDGGATWGFCTTPTPGTSNDGLVWYSEVLNAPQFSHQAGFYTEPFQLTLSSEDPEVTIYYTLDGSEPDPANQNGKTYSYKNHYPRNNGDTTLGPLLYRQMRTQTYAEPLQITDRSSQPYQLAGINIEFSYATRQPLSNPFKGTVVRAKAFKENTLPSRSITNTYFVNPGMKTRYTLPVISIVTSEDNLFDYQKGIYVAGKIGDDWRLSNPWTDYNPSRPTNFVQRGIEWERAAHFEMFAPDGEIQLTQNIGVRTHGGWSRAWFPKSLRLYARSEYDTEDTFKYPFFKGLEKRGEPGTPLTSFRRLAIRNSGNDWSQSYFRDALMHHLVRHLPIDTMAYRPAVHFINGEYWGMINLRERYDDDYLYMHYGVDTKDVVILTYSDAQVDTGFPSDRDHFTEVVAYAQNNNPAQATRYNWLSQRVDVDNLALYYAIQVYYNNTDWPHNNIDFWRKRTAAYEPDAPYGHDGRWRWLLYDTDFGFGHAGGVNDNSLNRVLTGSLGLTNTLFRRLMTNTQFRNTFINAMADNINTSFKPDRVNALIDAFNAPLQPLRSEHNNRWQAGTGAQSVMKTFASQRPAVVRSNMLSAFSLSGTYNLSIARNADWGHVKVNSVLINSQTPGLASPNAPYPWTGQYYNSVPITVQAIPRLGYRFSHWQGAPAGVNSASPTLTLSLTANTTLTAVFVSPALIHYWSANNSASPLAPTYTIGGGDVTIQPGPTTTVLGDNGQDFAGQNNRLGEPVGSHVRINDPLGATLTLRLPTTGYEQLVLIFEARRSGQGAGQQIISYSTDGQTFTPFETITVEDEAPRTYEIDFTGISGANNNPDFAVRFAFAQGDGGLSGNIRLDNMSLDAIPRTGTNQPPKLVAAMPFREIVENTTPAINLMSHFMEPDGEEITFTAWVDKPFIIETSIADGIVTLSPQYRGDAIVTVQADDGITPPIKTSFRVLVYPKAHILTDADFQFGYWSPNQSEYIFPQHMLFVQSTVSDPGLDAALLNPYFIPHDDYHIDDQAVIGFPYAATGRTRLNGLAEQGIAFINTGRERDLGGAIMAISTAGVEAVDMSWLCQTIAQNSRQYAVRLQYRVGHTGPFTDVILDGHPVEYLSSVSGDTQLFDAVRLPAAAMGRPYVQLLWRYYHVSGTSGARAQIRLDDIAVTAPTFPYEEQTHVIPGRIQATAFDVGGQGITYYDTTPGNSGGQLRPYVDVDIVRVVDSSAAVYAIDDIDDGEWLLYTVNTNAVETDIYARVASAQSGGQIRVLLDDVLLTTIDVPDTGGLNAWQTVSAYGLHLPERENAVMKLEFVGSGFRLGWVDFQRQRPYQDAPIAIPGRLEFEDYDIGGLHISYFDKTHQNAYGYYRSDFVDILRSQDTDTGFAVFAANEEWLEYTCDIVPGMYTISVRSSSQFSPQTLTLSQGDRTLAVFTLPNTNGFYNWQNTAVTNVYLPGDVDRPLRLTMTTSSASLNYVDFIRQGNIADITHNGAVGLEDFAVLAAQWGGTPGTPSADIAPPGGDGVVDMLDLLMLAENWLMD